MTEREQFEKAFPVPVSMVWNGFTYAIVDAHEISSCWDYQLRWETWQAARATPAQTNTERLAKRIRDILGPYNDDTESLQNLISNLVLEHEEYFDRIGQLEQAARATPALPDGMAIVPVDKLPAAVAVELSRLRDFRSAVIGWRESDHPEGFCRKTAEFVVLLGQIAAKDELK